MGQPETVNMEVIPHYLSYLFVTFILNVLDDVSYADMWEDVLGIAKAVAFSGAS